MKLTAITITLFLLFIPNTFSVNQQDKPDTPKSPQVQNQDLQRLEAQLEIVDKLSNTVEVDVNGEDESSGQITFTQVFKRAGSKQSVEMLPLFTIDLSKIDVPDEYIDAKIEATFKLQKPMCGTIPSVIVSHIDVSKNYRVEDDYTYPANRREPSITVPKGFVYDRASIPRIFWVLIDKDSLGNVAPLIHDFLYRHGGKLPPNQVSPSNKRFSRDEADNLFLEIMEKCGVDKARRKAAYMAVRQFAESSWKGQR